MCHAHKICANIANIFEKIKFFPIFLVFMTKKGRYLSFYASFLRVKNGKEGDIGQSEVKRDKDKGQGVSFCLVCLKLLMNKIMGEQSLKPSSVDSSFMGTRDKMTRNQDREAIFFNSDFSMSNFFLIFVSVFESYFR